MLVYLVRRRQWRRTGFNILTLVILIKLDLLKHFSFVTALATLIILRTALEQSGKLNDCPLARGSQVYGNSIEPELHRTPLQNLEYLETVF